MVKFLAEISDNSQNIMPHLKLSKLAPVASGWVQYLLLPFLVLRELLGKLCRKSDSNVVYQGSRNSGYKTGAFSLGVDHKEVSAFCKRNKCTLEHYYMAIWSKTLNDYMGLLSLDFVNKDFCDLPPQVSVGVPVSMQLGKVAECFGPGNHTLSMSGKLPVCETV